MAKSTTRCCLSIACCLLLAACGGGGGGGGGGDGSNVPADFALSTSQLSFAGVQSGPSPPAQSITITATGGTFGTSGTVYLSTSIDGNAVDHVEFTSCAGSVCSLAVTARGNVAAGSYTSQITVSGCTNFQCVTPVGTPKILNVSYLVSSGPTLSSPDIITIGAAPNVAPTPPLLVLQSTDSGAAWSATVSYESGAPGWLADIPGGTGSQQLPLQVGPQPEGDYRARISFKPVAGGTGTSTLVLLSVRAPRVTFVTPYIGVANQARRVTIRGFGFAALGAPQVGFGATPGTIVQVVDDTELRVDVPALPAGRYPISVSANAITLPGAPELVVVDPPAFAYQAIDRSGGGPTGLELGQLVYDAERQKIFLYEASGAAPPGPTPTPVSRIERYRFEVDHWAIDASLGVVSASDVGYPTATIALSPDGRELLRMNRQSITHYDPAPIDPAASLPLATIDARGALGADTSLESGAMANDGSFVGPAVGSSSGTVIDLAYRYDVLERAFYPLSLPATWTHAQWRIAVPTPSGARVLLPYAAAGFARTTFEYSASSGALTEIVPSGTLLVRIWGYSRDESVWIWGYEDTSGHWLEVTFSDPRLGGALSLAVVQHPIDAAAVAPDGQRLYYYESIEQRVHVLDLTNPQQVLNVFPEIAVSAPIADPPGTGAQMIITPDGGSLVVAGKDRVVVMPTP